MQAMFSSHGTRPYFAPISHPSSVGLVERQVLLLTSQLRKWIYDKGSSSEAFLGKSHSGSVPEYQYTTGQNVWIQPREHIVRLPPGTELEIQEPGHSCVARN